MSPEILTQLLGSMNSGRLLVVCGAGLSMAAPSNLPSAQVVAEKCFDKYSLEADPDCDPALREDLEALAEHFVSLNTLKSMFINHLVPWRDFLTSSNVGHAAIADFLITRAAVAVVSSNYDTLIESCAWAYGSDFRGSLDGDEATADAYERGPLLKFHGCSIRDRNSTVWAPSQLDDPTIAARIKKSKVWMAANLRQKDLLVVGFWSDWHYLNAVLSEALIGMQPLSVTVVDPSSTQSLKEKAPDLWDLSHAKNVNFKHVQESGADVLDELRREFSKNYLHKVLAAGKEAFEKANGTPCDPNWLKMEECDSETFYAWRRDAEGVSSIRPATRLNPRDSEVLGFFHLQLRKAGAVGFAAGYDLDGRKIRVINGAGNFLDSLRDSFKEPPAATSADIVVAVGAINPGVPSNVVRRGRSGDVVRPNPAGRWLDMESAQKELNI